MDVDPDVHALGVKLADSAVRNGAQFVADRIGALRARSQDRETILGLEQIINDLLADKNELLRIAQAYQSELVAQTLSAGDVQYIVATVVPVLRRLLEASEDEDALAKVDETMRLIEPLLSIETVNVLQLVGFNFRRAIGGPLTELVSGLIAARSTAGLASTSALQQAIVERDVLLLRTAFDADATARFERLRSPGS